MFREQYADVFSGDDRWQSLNVPTGDRFAWEADSTYIRNPPFFEGISLEPTPLTNIAGARALALLGDSITTDHISPAGSIKKDSPAGKYLMAHGVAAGRLQFVRRAARQPRSDDARHVRERAAAQPARARHRGRLDDVPAGRRGDDDLRRRDEIQGRRRAADRPGRARSTGRGRRATGRRKGRCCSASGRSIAESFERIHRSNLVNMGVLPLQFRAGATAASLGLTGQEQFDIVGVADGLTPGGAITVRARARRVGHRADRVPGRRADRHARGAGGVPSRRDPALRAAAAGGKEELVIGIGIRN